MEPLFPYFGNKRKLDAWKYLGDVNTYIEPFCGTAAMLLRRPDWHKHTHEIINDWDGMVTNFHRTVKYQPDAILDLLNYPVCEVDIHTSMFDIFNNHEDLPKKLQSSWDYCEPELAARWLLCQTWGIGGLSKPGPWIMTQEGFKHKKDIDIKNNNDYRGICISIPSYHDGKKSIWARGGVRKMQKRLQTVKIANGDWSRVVTATITHDKKDMLAGIFLDPPYQNIQKNYYYKSDNSAVKTVAAEVNQWCAENGHSPNLRIVLCGYNNEHDNLLNLGWRKEKGIAGGSGYGAAQSGLQERIWISPSCLNPDGTQQPLF